VSSAERKGKAPPLERGRGRHSSPANPGRVTARASEQRDNGVRLSKTMDLNFLQHKVRFAKLAKIISKIRRTLCEESKKDLIAFLGVGEG
jgi:hypothetical protein